MGGVGGNMTEHEVLPIEGLRAKFYTLCRLSGGASHISNCNWCELLRLALAGETELTEKEINFLEAHLVAQLASRQG